MAKEVFDQAQPQSNKAKLFAEAFRGCDEWTIPPRKRRSSGHSIHEAGAVYDAGSFRSEIVDIDFREAA